jgi:hypothetical protein
LEGVACPDLFCLLVLTVVLPAFGLLTDLDRANTAHPGRRPGHQHDEDPP